MLLVIPFGVVLAVVRHVGHGHDPHHLVHLGVLFDGEDEVVLVVELGGYGHGEGWRCLTPLERPLRSVHADQDRKQKRSYYTHYVFGWLVKYKYYECLLSK